jgi:flagellum-specific peptidoglycan hydrolase FlgJ
LWRGHRKATYEGGAEPTGDAQATAQQAAALAQRVSAKTGIAPDLLWSQWAHETGGFKHLGGTNNLAGVNIPGGHGKDYRNFSSLDEFGDYYANMMRPGGRYSGIEQATSPEDFAGRLKQGGYYADTQSNYTAGVERWDKQYQKSYGDDSQAVTIGSVNVHINQPNASPQEVQARVSAGVLDGLRTATQRNLLEFQGAFA